MNEDISQIIQTIIIILLVTGFLAYAVMEIFYRGRKIKIHVTDKFTSSHKGLNQTRSKDISVKHYLIECTYPDSDKRHTLNCNSSFLYNTLNVGNDYIVTVKMLHIIRVHKKD